MLNNFSSKGMRLLKKALSGIALLALVFTSGVFGGFAPNLYAAAPTFSEVAVVPSSGTRTADGVIDVYFREAAGVNNLDLVNCSVNGKSIDVLANLSNGLYRVVYIIGPTDTERAAGTLPLDCTFENQEGEQTTVTAFMDNNTLAIDTNGDGTIAQPTSTSTTATTTPPTTNNSTSTAVTISAVEAVPSSGTLGNGGQLEVFFQESHNMTDLALSGACSINGVSVSPLTHEGNGLYKVVYTVAGTHTDRSSGTIPVNCTFQNGAGQTASATSFTDGNTLAIDANPGSGGTGNTGGNQQQATSTFISLSSVSTNPSSGLVARGDTLVVSIQESNNATDITLSPNATCQINDRTIPTLENVGNGLYRLAYTVAQGDPFRSPGSVPINCTLINSSQSEYGIFSFTDGNTVSIDANASSTGNTATTTTGNNNQNGTTTAPTATTTTSNGALALRSIDTVRGVAVANGTFESGWAWAFNLTVPTNETNLQMKFSDWTLSGTTSTSSNIGVFNNVRVSSAEADAAASSSVAQASGVYTTPLILTGDLDPAMEGRQVRVLVEVRVPQGTAKGSYSTSYGVLSWE